ncbi:hypothetical protein DEO72_LG11g2070 [Vigna unguiculata]|uniref:Disease resistance protein RPM1 n=1 Tax=Vigna unguiculata TaxID=3917 RepID=A0A4D6NQ01_VIGUN|nr:hypothetical protein DEO72_LG11g2070 [Vigna unguiculata]
MEGVHEALEHMIAIESLTLIELPYLESLRDCFGNFSLLHDLTIHNCSKLRCLPPCLSHSVEYLTISSSTNPWLEKDVSKKKGGEWPKIAHIPCLDLSK